MAGSFHHCLQSDELGEISIPYQPLPIGEYLLENGGDYVEAIEELLGMVFYLTNGDKQKLDDACSNFHLGLNLVSVEEQK